MESSLAQAARIFLTALTPFSRALAGTDDHVLRYARALGWILPEVPQALKVLRTSGDSLMASLARLENALREDASGSGANDLEAAEAEFLATFVLFTVAMEGLGPALRTQLPAPFVAATQIDATIKDRIFEDALSRQLEYQARDVYLIATVLGLLENTPQAADPAHFQPAYEKRVIRWDRLPMLVSDPAGLMRDVYGWGTQALDAAKLLLALRDLSLAFLAPASFDYGARALLRAIVPELPDTIIGERGLSFAFFTDSPLAFTLSVYPFPKRQPDEQQGLVLTFGGLAKITDTIAITPSLSLRVSGQVDLASGIAFAFWPDRPPKLMGGFATSAMALVEGASAAITLTYAPPDQTQRLPVLSFSGFQMDLKGAAMQAGFGVTGGAVDGSVAVSAAGLRMQLGGLGQDSLLSSVLPDALTLEFDLGVGWSATQGLHWQTGAGPSITLPVDVSVGPVKLHDIEISLTSAGEAFQLGLGISASARIGPVELTIAGIGAALSLDPNGGNLGPIGLGFHPMPPNGIGLAVDTAGLTGGGFLSHDEAAAQYAGMLQLAYQEFQLQAFGLVATKLPSGPGYSMVAMIDATFPPIELVAGFTLNGVGGLLGIHRTISIDALQAGLKAKTLSNFLFAKNPVANAAQLLTDLATFFPAADGRYVFGPMLQIGWGTPTLITIDLALILELPDPVRLVLIGELAVLLPTPDAPLVELHMDVLGTLDFGTDEGSLDAVLHDSHLVNFPLHGAMALRGCWAGGDKTTLLSVGGFHPKFQPPPGFPALERLSVSMPSGHISKLNLTGYLAVSSNTLQIGAHVDLFVGVDGFGIAGYLNFDTLIERNPFYFDGDISGGVTLSVDGEDLMTLDLSADLTGPAPWHCAGHVHFSVLGFGVDKSFSAAFGDPASTLPTTLIDVGSVLRAALGDPRNCTATLTTSQNGLVSLRTPVASGVALGHPAATLTINQRIAPLDLTLQKFGAGAPQGESLFSITAVTADGAIQPKATVSDVFAPAQFLTLSDDDELAAPSFETFDSGATVAAGAVTFGPILTREITYETWLADTVGGQPREDTGITIPPTRVIGILTGLLDSGTLRYAAPSQPMLQAPTLQYVVATTDQIAASGVGVATGQSYAQARATLAAAIQANPDQRGTLQVVAHYEVP